VVPSPKENENGGVYGSKCSTACALLLLNRLTRNSLRTSVCMQKCRRHKQPLSLDDFINCLFFCGSEKGEGKWSSEDVDWFNLDLLRAASFE
jgi:hypothetical protein